MIQLDYRDHRPIYEQVRDSFQKLILAGVLEPGSEMPSVRSLATQLAVNPNTIQRAYRELEARGFICSVKGKGSFVSLSNQASNAHKAELFASFDQIIEELLSLGETPDSLVQRIKEFKNE